ncbi:MAG: hypothetical protein NTV97_25955 [Alphaproteobacteria bacterium]|nr:hypothetical protein [Alphaproteobacteria bacterium]
MFTKLASFAVAATLILATIAPPAHAQAQVTPNGNGQTLDGAKQGATNPAVEPPTAAQ